MFWSGTKITAIMALISFGALITNSVNSEPINFVAQNSFRKTPKGRVPATPRNPDCPAIADGMPTLTAITPLDAAGITRSLSQNPTFRFYSPYVQGKYRFRLLKTPKSLFPLYTQNITGHDKVGIFAISLPMLTAIKPQEYYFWELEYFCSDKPDADNPIVFGRLYRDRLTDAQNLELSKLTTPSDRIAFYQKYGIWSELLDEIAKRLPASQTLWQQTLDAEGLQSVSKQSVISIQP